MVLSTRLLTPPRFAHTMIRMKATAAMLTTPAAITVTLTTPARTSSPLGTSDHVARIEPGRSGQPVLVIDGTPGRWDLASLNGAADSIAIDFGAEWFLVNLAELLGEARRMGAFVVDEADTILAAERLYTQLVNSACSMRHAASMADRILRNVNRSESRDGKAYEVATRTLEKHGIPFTPSHLLTWKP